MGASVYEAKVQEPSVNGTFFYPGRHGLSPRCPIRAEVSTPSTNSPTMENAKSDRSGVIRRHKPGTDEGSTS